jgi:hypothetical protein
MKLMSSLLFLALLNGAAQAADLKGAKAPEPAAPEAEFPGGDIFGFTSATDVGNVGDKGLALENDGSYGRRDMRSRVLTQKLELSRTFAPNWAYAASLFGAYSSFKDSGTSRETYHFDGMSMEVRHRFIERSATNPFAFTFAIEPRWGRVDTVLGQNATNYGAEFKLQADRALSEKIFWAVNANFGTSRGRDATNGTWANSSESVVSTALTYAVVDDKLFMGGEVRWNQAWSKGFFGKLDGQALFVGPTIAYKASDSVMLNAVFLPQIAGKARSVAGPFDIDNFERANFRLKLSVGL